MVRVPMGSVNHGKAVVTTAKAEIRPAVTTVIGGFVTVIGLTALVHTFTRRSRRWRGGGQPAWAQPAAQPWDQPGAQPWDRPGGQDAPPPSIPPSTPAGGPS